jgi:SOS-response transcriptional repressor LexA
MPRGEEPDIYRELMRFKPEGLTANAWAVKAGVSRTVWADMRRHGNPSRRTLAKLLTAAGSSLAEFEALRVGAAPVAVQTAPGAVGDGVRRTWASAPLRPLPLVTCAVAGEWGEAGSGIDLLEVRERDRIDLLPRPPSLAADWSAYAITVPGDSMWPRFRRGRRLAVSPRSPAENGDDVLVLLKKPLNGARAALLMELVRRAPACVELRQFNPDVTLKVDSEEVESIHKVAGELF